MSNTHDIGGLSLLEHACKLRSRTMTWCFFFGLGWLLFVPTDIEPTPPQVPAHEASFRQTCIAHCINNMPHVCQNQWTCNTFCSQNAMTSGVSVEKRSNGEQFITVRGVMNCEAQCNDLKAPVCQGKLSCEQMCDRLYSGATHQSKSKNGWFILGAVIGEVIVGMIILISTSMIALDLLCSYLRIHRAYMLVTPPTNTDASIDVIRMDSATFRCGVVILVRSLLEWDVLMRRDLVWRCPTIWLLLVMEDGLQVGTKLEAPENVWILATTWWFLRVCFQRYGGDVDKYAVPFARPVAAIFHAEPRESTADPTESTVSSPPTTTTAAAQDTKKCT